jgi:hypothetical protein
MERSTYQLRIEADEKQYDTISSLLGLKPKSYAHGWSYEIVLEEEPTTYDVVERFLLSLQNKFELLAGIGVRRGDISVWIIYAYNGQCNMEFAPNILKCLGDSGIALCISCYEAGIE